jgi:GTPase SAR1 family protein
LTNQVHRQWSASDVNDAAFQTAYARALKQSSRPFPFTQLCLVGEGRAGKTALANYFCGRAFEQTESTIGVGIDHLQADSKLASHDWFAIPSSRRAVNFAEEQLAWAVMEQLDSNPCPSRESMAEAMQVRHHASQPFPSLEDPQTAPPPTHKHAPAAAGMCISEQSSMACEQHPSPPTSALGEHLEHAAPATAAAASESRGAVQHNTTRDPERAAAPAVRLEKQIVLQRAAEQEPLRIKLMDFGGQKSFYSLHHLYLTRHGVYATSPSRREKL